MSNSAANCSDPSAARRVKGEGSPFIDRDECEHWGRRQLWASLKLRRPKILKSLKFSLPTLT